MVSHRILIYISLMTKNVEYLYMCLLAIHVSFLVKCLLKSFAHFLKQLFVLFLSYKSYLHILDTSPIADM